MRDKRIRDIINFFLNRSDISDIWNGIAQPHLASNIHNTSKIYVNVFWNRKRIKIGT